MENTCPSCEQLISQGIPHPYLVTISSLQDSQLSKCRCCNSYLHSYLDNWEVISAGHYNHCNTLTQRNPSSAEPHLLCGDTHNTK